jgi:clan AA aspartic protease (TIGR02281 family)
MISVDVDLGANSSIKAMVDTGCAFPMALPDGIAANLLQNHLATLAGNTRVTLATGKTESVTVIMINRVTVDGRTLHGVEAVVAKGNDASILLGLGALNQLGPFKIDDGKLVFTGEQPT